MSKPLPEQFNDLGRFTDKWVLTTEADRHRTRLSSTFEELKDLYDTMLPKMEAIIQYLNGFKLGELPEKEDNLMKLALGFMEVTCAVECFKRAGIRGFDPSRMKVYM